MKETGILLAVSSLPSRTGVGELGRSAYEWIDLLAGNGVSIWQILPLNPTGYGNSPYQPYSSCAGDELYLSLELLAQQGLLPEVPEFAGANPGRVEYEAVRAWKEPLLRAACAAFQPDEEYNAFARQDWVQNYSVFRAFKKANESRCWLEWPQWQRDWPQTRQGDLSEFAEEIAYHSFLQYQFLNQWKAVR
ncbi:4-alpha-glucanotransferase, partial [Allofournierella massiliensis]|uniref:4-alpha-glucanotransferase n=1 Tax=Allofournierella massiliensis TaxID=1650663 RepID=UPI0024B13E2C